MRVRLLAAAAALIGLVSFASAQAPVPSTLPAIPSAAPAPVAAPPGMMLVPVPPAQAPVAAPAPVVVQAPAGCATPAPAAASDCGPKVRSNLLSRKLIGCGTANPVGCGTLATERTFLFGGCNQFFTPCRTCGGSEIEYGSGGLGDKDNCKRHSSYHNR